MTMMSFFQEPIGKAIYETMTSDKTMTSDCILDICLL